MYCLHFSIFGRFVTFPDLREVVLYRKHPNVPAVHSPLTSRAVGSGVAPRVAPCVGWPDSGPLHCCILAAVGSLADVAGPRLLGALPCLCGDCQPLVVQAVSRGGRSQSPEGPGAHAGPLLGRVVCHGGWFVCWVSEIPWPSGGWGRFLT